MRKLFGLPTIYKRASTVELEGLKPRLDTLLDRLLGEASERTPTGAGEVGESGNNLRLKANVDRVSSPVAPILLFSDT